ncbi:hypothetical protein GJ700_01760 [Duganella sp. FT92W]|uniref:Uncharacterized protein n=1 Tax=Pseudoduganella rivuli TaxID=2666085 RepID=A0A7X2IJ55_9BURK|nr:hypothetical protein [Pseudoduganella rivuli]MRV70448.1 hypothetical protein [Pseudoduganella rivuli]
MSMHVDGSAGPREEGELQRYRHALQAALGLAASARFEVGEGAGHVFAYSRADGVIYVLLKARRHATARFSFVSTALALSGHLGKLVVPRQNSLRAVFADGAPPDMVTAYRFAVEDPGGVQAP